MYTTICSGVHHGKVATFHRNLCDEIINTCPKYLFLTHVYPYMQSHRSSDEMIASPYTKCFGIVNTVIVIVAVFCNVSELDLDLGGYLGKILYMASHYVYSFEIC